MSLIAKEASNQDIKSLALSASSHYYLFHMYGKQLEPSIIASEEITHHSDGQEFTRCTKTTLRRLQRARDVFLGARRLRIFEVIAALQHANSSSQKGMAGSVNGSSSLAS